MFQKISGRKTIQEAQKGFSLVEFMIVAALAAIGLVVVFNTYQAAGVTSKVNTEAQNLTTITGKIRSVYAGRSSYTGLSNTTILNARGFPGSMVNGAVVNNVWGGTVTLGVNATAGFDVTYTDIPTAECVELVGSIGATFRTVTVGGTAVKAATDANADIAATNTQCAAAASTTIIFNGV